VAHHRPNQVRRYRLAAIAAAGAFAALAVPLKAQDNSDAPNSDYLERLKSCQLLEDDIARLDCFDAAVAGIVEANDAGEVQVIDQDDVRETKRSLFGFSLPDIGLFGGDDDEEDERLETTIQSVRYLSRRRVRFTTAEGAVWEMNNVPRRLREIREGDQVVFKKASLGYFFVRIAGQTGVKGRRIQ